MLKNKKYSFFKDFICTLSVFLFFGCNSNIEVDLINDENQNTKLTNNRNIDSYKELLTLPLGWGGKVTDIKVLSDIMYVAYDEKGVRIFDVSNKNAPELLTFINFAEPILSLEISGSTLYIMGYNDFLYVYDVSNSNAPSIITKKYITSSAQDTFLLGNYLYIAALGSGFFVVDISNPSNPTTIRTLSGTIASQIFFPYSITVIGNNAYASDYFGKRLISIDVSNPSASLPVLDIFNLNGSSRMVKKIDSNHLIVSDSLENPHIIDVSNPANMNSISRIPEVSSGQYSVNGNILYINDFSNIIIYDISNLNSPLEIGTFTKSHDYTNVSSFFDSHLYLGDDDNGIHIYDMTNPSSENLSSIIVSNSNVSDVAISKNGNYAYLASNIGLITLDYSNKNNPTFLSLNTEFTGALNSVVRKDNYLFAYDSTNFKIYSFLIDADESPPKLIDSISVVTGSNPGKIIVSENRLLVPAGTSGVHILDITSPNNLSIISSIATGGSASNTIIHNNNLFVAAGISGLLIYDISNISSPNQLGQFNTGIDQIFDVKVSDNFAYVADRMNGFKIIDISDKTTPSFYSGFDPGGLASTINLVEDKVLLGLSTGMTVLNIANPATPNLDIQLPHYSWAKKVRVRDNYLIVANDNTGFYWVDLNDTSNIKLKD